MILSMIYYNNMVGYKSTTQLDCVGCLLKDLEREGRCYLLTSPGLSVQKRVKGIAQPLEVTEQCLVDGCLAGVIMFLIGEWPYLCETPGQVHAPDIKGLLAKQVVH